MTEKAYFVLDWSMFNTKLKQLAEMEIPKYAEIGLFRAMNELLNDSITKPPQAPKDMGDLWGSRTGVMPGTTLKVKETAKSLSITGGFHIKYAHRHHEVQPGTFKYTKTKGADQPGPKFMQSKMAQYGKKYFGIIADTIRKKGK